ncbi:P22 phage major capsid protein family protein [Herbaspirillum sp. YR522]|uniref:P22 phage major capsid protein family protein n=1 Tax=Herbaspirillum sp. YR522 TaxID=1144342 RepID=UPI00026FB350|nr:P22 phage major capsid protein family protein [Herbaspirillum sp. YR522]EJN07797.1 P22 coat protein [Herbaspirillum sp. YR522]
MGALTLTNLIPTIYEAMDVVSRELVGFIPAVSRDSSAERAALNEVVMSPVVGAMAAEDLQVGAYAADTPNQTIGNVAMTIDKARSVPFGITGEETKALQNGGTLAVVNRDRIAQALRTLTNEVESDLAGLHIATSRAYGTYNTTPFGTASDLSDFAQSRKILDDNGAPQSDLHLVLGSTAVANIRGKQSGLFRVNEAGTDDLLRRGSLGDVEGLQLHNSGQVKKNVTTGTAASATTNTAGYAVGATIITLAAAGTGTAIVGDIVTFAGDSNKYLLAAGNANVAAGGTITLQEPGLQQAIPAAATAVTIIAATTRNMFFHRSAIQLATRAPAMPEGGDAADDVMMVTDPVSGITYEFCIYRQKRQVRYEVNLAWGKKMVTPRHSGTLIGA